MGYGDSVKFYRVYDPEKERVVTSKDVRIYEDTEKREDKTRIYVCPFDDLPETKQKIESKDSEDPETELDTTTEKSTDPTDSTDEEDFVEEIESIHQKAGAHVAKTDTKAEPASYQEALVSYQEFKQERVGKAMEEEIHSLINNKTWKIVKPPTGKKIIGNKWVFRIKEDRDGKKRFKARLVAKGFTQKEGIDYKETYAPVVKYDTVRILLSIAAARDLKLKQFDVKSALLYGDLEEDIYISQPDGFQYNTNAVCKLQKGLYGLKQSP